MATGQAISGKYGSVWLPGTPLVPIAEIRSWDLTVVADNYDASVLGDTWREFVRGLRGWSGTLTGYYDLVNDVNGQLVLYNALVLDASVVLVLQTAQGGGAYEGTCNVTQAAISTPVDNLISLNFSYVGNGSLQSSPY